MQRTCALIKPDLVAKKLTGKVISMIEENGFEIVGMQKFVMSRELAEEFYEIHEDKPFYNDIVEFMSSGPIIAMVLEKEDAVNAWRNLMGATNPSNAAAGTVRALYGKSIQENGTHGSDSQENAENEIYLIFEEESYECNEEE